MKDLTTENIKNNIVGKVFEDCKSCYVPNHRRTYHSGTKDMIMNEVFRRVEPQKRTMSEYYN